MRRVQAAQATLCDIDREAWRRTHRGQGGARHRQHHQRRVRFGGHQHALGGVDGVGGDRGPFGVEQHAQAAGVRVQAALEVGNRAHARATDDLGHGRFERAQFVQQFIGADVVHEGMLRTGGRMR